MRYRDLIAVFLVFCLVITAQAQDSAALAVLFRQAAERESKDMAGAVRLYENSARQGHTPSMVRLGYLRQSGAGVPRDLPGAFALFTEAAKAGNLDGQFLLAMNYAQGVGTAKDLAAARKLFLQPAAAGYQYAQCALGIMLESGEGGPRKVAAARRWLDRAAAGPDAALAKRAANLRDEVDKKLFAINNSGTILVGLLLIMAAAGAVIEGGGLSSGGPPSGPGSPTGGPAPAPRIRCYPVPVFGSGTLSGRDAVQLSQQTRMVCE